MQPDFQAPPPSGTAQKPNTTRTILILVGVLVACFCLGIPILAALLFPVFQQARKAAKGTETLANLKMMGTSANIYAADYDDVLMPKDDWQVALYPYVKNELVFQAPQADAPVEYAFNEVLSRGDLTSLATADRTPLFFETSLPGPSAYGGLSSVFVRDKKAAVSFADSSARRIDPSDLPALDWTPKIRTR